MDAPVVHFNEGDRPDFFKTVRQRVNSYFKENNISRHANFNMKFKTGFMLTLYITPLVLMLTGVIANVWLVFLMWFLMGLGMSGIGLCIMHDANHGSYSKKRNVNRFFGFILNILGAYHINWKIQHNVLHHSFTNIEGYDEDIEQLVMRLSPTQKRKKLHRFQVFYAPFFYGIMTLYWVVAKDFIQLAGYGKRGLISAQGLSRTNALIFMIINKLWYYGALLVLPIIFVDVAWWQTLLGFVLMHWVCGIVLAFVFQAAHVIEETNFYETDERGGVENNWAIHQMKTTANFANNSRLFSWCIGGLNYQIEHHLFPNICHVHYRKISKIVKKTAEEFNVPYYHHKTFLRALRSHFKLLNQLGTT